MADDPNYPPDMRYLIWREWADDPATRARAEAEIAALHPGDPQLAHFDSRPIDPGAFDDWLASASLAAPLRAACEAACPDSVRSCTRAAYELVSSIWRRACSSAATTACSMSGSPSESLSRPSSGTRARAVAPRFCGTRDPLPRCGRDRCEGGRRGRLLAAAVTKRPRASRSDARRQLFLWMTSVLIARPQLGHGGHARRTRWGPLVGGKRNCRSLLASEGPSPLTPSDRSGYQCPRLAGARARCNRGAAIVFSTPLGRRNSAGA